MNMSENFDSFSDYPVETEYEATTTIVGRIKRASGIGRGEATRKAQKYDWWEDDLKYDGRCKRWHVFRKSAY